MAYMSQEHKKEIAVVVKPILKKYGIKATMSVENHSTIHLNISKGSIPFQGDNVNPYHIERQWQDQPEAKNFLVEVNKALHGPRFYDNSDAMTDYFDTSHSVRINIGKWNKPYVYDASIKKG